MHCILLKLFVQGWDHSQANQKSRLKKILMEIWNSLQLALQNYSQGKCTIADGMTNFLLQMQGGIAKFSCQN